MLVRRPPDIAPSEITAASLFARRRQLILATGAAAGLALSPFSAKAAPPTLKISGRADHAGGEKPTARSAITEYNNFYEFSTDKRSPARLAQAMRIEPWTVTVEGEVLKPATFDIDQLRRLAPMEERIYRLRCVEAWSAVVPWAGFPLATLIDKVQPTGQARYVAFETLADKEDMPGLRSRVLDWPYLEALRLDEARHPLTLLAFGLYGDWLPKQNGAPLRLVVPWKYGFKSAKSLVRIRFLRDMPHSAWMKASPREYGFYANVNPSVDHPRWSQARERRLGEFLKRPTLPFNGYAEQVASLYAGMDLRLNF